jgi:hypothetical protein
VEILQNQKQKSASLVKSSNSIAERLNHQIYGRSQIASPTHDMKELDIDLSEDTVSYDLENVLDGCDGRWCFITFYFLFFSLDQVFQLRDLQ